MTETAAHRTGRRATPPQAWTRAFPGRPDQIRHARQCLARMLEGCPVADDAVLCLSELASNSVIHSESRKPDGTFTVRAEIRHGEYVRIEVHDRGGPWEQRPHADGRGHGLDIVRDLAADSGIDGDALTGWVAWARLDWPAADASPGGAGTDATPVQVLEALSAELARHGTYTAWISAREGQLTLVQGRAIGYAAGFYWWPAGRLSRGRPLYAIHAAQDPAGAARRIASLPPPG
ncbi:MAG TPA: ATP-binding protein [Streptosporangiaceae bacterium]|nr:ATP-binding protein [Streptosporangiaceae bacterium]